VVLLRRPAALSHFLSVRSLPPQSRLIFQLAKIWRRFDTFNSRVSRMARCLQWDTQYLERDVEGRQTHYLPWLTVRTSKYLLMQET
jgi:hypothetical protein